MKIHLKYILALIFPLMLINAFMVFMQPTPTIALQIYILTNALLVPGFVLSILLGIRTKNIWLLILHSVGLSIALIYFLGFFASFLLPTLGLLRPLDKIPYTILHTIIVSILIGISLYQNWKRTLSVETAISMLLQASGVVFALLCSFISIAGAAALNNGGTNSLSLAWFFFALFLFFVSLLFQNKYAAIIQPYILFIVSLSTMWMLSARSSHIIGWDIIEELQVAKTTMFGGRWSLLDIRDAYNACLSISILPTVLNSMSLATVEFLYKFVYTLIFSLFPVTIYFWLSSINKKKFAMLAVLYIIAQPFFNQSMVGLARQEIAFFFFALLLLAIFATTFTKKSKIALILIYISALVTSHYSTSYVSILLFLGPYSMILFFKILKLIPMPTFVEKLWIYKNWIKSYKSSLKWWIVLFLIGFTYTWYFLFTKTGTGVGTMVVNSLSGMTKLFQNEQKSQEVKNALPGANAAITTDEDLVAYEHQYDQYLENLDSERIEMIYEKYPAHPINDIPIEPTISPENASAINSIFLKMKDGLKYILLFGVLIQCLRTFRKTEENLDLVLFSSISAALLLVTIFHPTLGVNYNIARIYLQLLSFLAFSLIVGLDALLWLIPQSIRKIILAVTLFSIFIFLQGALTPQLGGTPVLQFYQNGTDFEKYYAYDGEMSSADWLARNHTSQAIYGDSFSGLRIRSVSNISANPAIVPIVLDNDRYSYVYVSRVNLIEQKALVNFASKFLTFSYPLGYLDDYRNKMYSNKSSVIYK